MKLFSVAARNQARLAATFATCLAAWPMVHAQSLVIYDDFAGSLIAPNKWYGDEGRQYAGTRTEQARSVVNGQAHMELRTWGDITSDLGFSSSRNALVAVKSVNINTLQATITMRAEATYPCSTNTAQTSQARARLFGFYFNAADPSPGSNFNDVFAGMQVYRASNSTDPVGTMRVSAFIGICTDDACIGTSSLGSLDLGTVALNSPTSLRTIWDPANNRFSFQRDSASPVFLTYTVSDKQAASFPAKRIEITNVVPHCTSPTRPSVFTSADFDNVYTNPIP